MTVPATTYHTLQTSVTQAPTLVAQALRAARTGNFDEAWRCADKLCRTVKGPAHIDALMLRSTVFALRGDRASAQSDLRAAAYIDPESIALNCVLLDSPVKSERRAAARQLLRSEVPTHRNLACRSLVRDGIQCAGTISRVGDRLVGRVGWNGANTINLEVRTDAGDLNIKVRAASRQRPDAFSCAGRFEAELPCSATVAKVVVSTHDAFFEPSQLLLREPDVGRIEREQFGINDDLLIVVPVYSGHSTTIECIQSVLAALPSDRVCRIIAVDDASPDAALSAALEGLAAAEHITLLRNTINMGFAGSVNRALALRKRGQDVLLLNADTLVPKGAIDGLSRHVERDATIGTVTPLSNNGEDTSFPRRFCVNDLPDISMIEMLHSTAARVNGGNAIEIPNGVGFCLYIRGEAADQISLLPLDYGRGYYEDVAYCLAIANAGFRNVCATDVYVGHHGSTSFGSDKRGLVVPNLRRINQKYPAYLRVTREFETSDPIKGPACRIEWELLRTGPELDVLLIPGDTPQFLISQLSATVAARSAHKLITVQARPTKHSLAIDIRGVAHTSPQNLTWNVSTNAKGKKELSKRLASLPVRAISILDYPSIPEMLVAGFCDHNVELTLLAGQHPFPHTFKKQGLLSPLTRAEIVSVTPNIAAARAGDTASADILSFDLARGLQIPAFKPGGPLVFAGLCNNEHDSAFLKAVADALSLTTQIPIVVVGSPARGSRVDAAVSLDWSGEVDDDELPTWLTRRGAGALLFADKKWAIADPRAATWSEAGLPIALFDWTDAEAKRIGRTLLLPRGGSARENAGSLVGWLSSVNAI